MHIWFVVAGPILTHRPDPRRVPQPVAFLSNRMHDPLVLAVTKDGLTRFERGDADATLRLLGARPNGAWPFGAHLTHRDRLMDAHRTWTRVFGPANWAFTVDQGMRSLLRGWTRDALFLANPPDVRRLDLWKRVGDHLDLGTAQRHGLTAHAGWREAALGFVFPSAPTAHTPHHARLALLRRLHEDLTLAGRVLHTGPTVLHPLDDAPPQGTRA